MRTGQKKYIPLLKGIGIFLGVVLVLVLIAAVWLGRYYKSVIREQLPQVIARAGKNKYKSSLEDVSINILTRKITLQGLRIWYDSTAGQAAPPLTFAVNIPHLHISSINWLALLQESRISCGLVQADHPDIQLITHKVDTAVKEAAPEPKQQKNAFPDAVDIGAISLKQAALSYKVQGDTVTTYTIKDADIRLYRWHLGFGPQEKKDTSRILYAADISAQCRDVAILQQPGFYSYTADTLELDTRARSLAVSDFRLKVTMSKKEFYRETGHEKDIFSVVFPQLQLSGFDLKEVLYRNRLAADTMQIHGGKVDVYFSRLPKEDPASKMGKFPNQLLLKLPLKLYIPYTKVTAGHASYTEVSEETELPGALKFDGLNGFIKNITNDSAAIRSNASCILDLQGKFNKDAPIHGRFNFLLSDTSGSFAVSGNLKQVKDAQITDAAKALAKVEVSSIEVQELDLKISGDQYRAGGDISFRYTDLALTVQKQEERGGKMKDRPFLSFLANKILLYPANPMPGQDVRKVRTEVKRDPHRSFFNLIWRNVLEGVKTTALRDNNITRAVQSASKNKEKNKGSKSELKTVPAKKK